MNNKTNKQSDIVEGLTPDLHQALSTHNEIHIAYDCVLYANRYQQTYMDSQSGSYSDKRNIRSTSWSDVKMCNRTVFTFHVSLSPLNSPKR